MNIKHLLLPLSAAVGLGTAPDILAVEYWLCAKPVTIQLPQGGKKLGDGSQVMKNVIMWGLVEARSTAAATSTATVAQTSRITNFNNGCNATGQNASVPGPRLIVPPGDHSLTIHLRNALPSASGEPISLMLTGQALPTVTSTGTPSILGVKQTPVASSGDYVWTGLKPGTYAYQSASHPQQQIPMGLYGVVTHDFAAGEVYPGRAYQNEAILVYSEVDPALYNHQNGTNAAQMNVPTSDRYGNGAAVASSINYRPEFYLINGKPFGMGDKTDATAVLNNLFAGAPLVSGGKTLLRMVNAGLQTHVPNMLGVTGEILAEDGNPYPYPRGHYAITLPAGSTRDVLIDTPDNLADIVPLVDRMGGLSAGDPTVSTIDPEMIPTAQDLASARADAGMLAKIQFGAEVPAQGVADSYTVKEGEANYTLTAATAVIVNDQLNQHAGHGTLQAVIETMPSQGTLADLTYSDAQVYKLLPSGIFRYTHNGGEFGDSLTYRIRVVANGSGPELAGSVLYESAPVKVTINRTPVNDRPVAVADTYTTNPALEAVATTNPFTLSLAAPGILANDTDADLPANNLTVHQAPRTVNTTRGRFVIQADGSFTYTPWTAATVGGSGVAGATAFTTTRTDSFTYQVNDNQNITTPVAQSSISTAATVTVNLVNTAPTRITPWVSGTPTYTISQSGVNSVQINVNDLFQDAEGNVDSNSPAAFTCGKGGTVAGTLVRAGDGVNWVYTAAPAPATGTNTGLGAKNLTCYATDVWNVSAVNNTATRNVTIQVNP